MNAFDAFGPAMTADDEKFRATLEQNVRLDQSDLGNAQRLLAWFGEDLVWVREVGPHVWTGTHWEADGAREAAERMAHETARRIRLECEVMQPADDEMARIAAGDQKACERFAARKAGRHKYSVASANRGKTESMLKQAAALRSVAPDALDADPMRVAVQNGTLRFARCLEPDPDCPDPEAVRMVARAEITFTPGHARADMISKVMPVAYDAGAAAPRWQAFLERFQPDAEIRRFLQVWHGLALTGLTEQAFVFNYGAGANGKSTFIEAIRRLMGGYAKTVAPESITGQNNRGGSQASPDVARLPGARLIVVSELPRGEALKENLVKALTGGEPILTRHNYGDFFEFTPVFKASMSGNDLPKIIGDDLGIWRRTRIVPWGVTIPEAERRPIGEVLAEFDAERPGILNWLIEGLRIYLEEGLRAPEGVRHATDEHRADMDPLADFIRTCVVRSPGDEVVARDMYQGFSRWCQANGVRPWTETAFGRSFPKRGFERTDGRIRTYRDCRLDLVGLPEIAEAKNAPAPPMR